MTLLAIDTGLATCGWAVVSEAGEILDLGVLITKPSKDRKVGKSVDKLRRLEYQSAGLLAAIRKHDVTEIAAEAINLPPRAQSAAIQSICLSWGNVVGLATSLGLPMQAVLARNWQRWLCGAEYMNANDYDVVTDEIMKRLPAATAARLIAIAKTNRSHAIDAVGMALYMTRHANDATQEAA